MSVPKLQFEKLATAYNAHNLLGKGGGGRGERVWSIALTVLGPPEVGGGN